MLNLRKKNKEEIWVNISNHTLVRTILWLLIAIIILAALRRMAHSLELVFIAFFLTLALNAPVHWLSKRMPGKQRRRRTLGTLASFLIVVALIAGFLVLITPPLVRNTTTFIHDIPHLLAQAENKNGTIGHFIDRYNLQPQIDTFARNLGSHLSNAPSTAVSTVGKIASKLVEILAVLAMTFMMLVEGPYWTKKGSELLPTERRKHVAKLASDMYQVIKGYVNGQVILAALAALFITPALFILHISTPLALMVVVFICGLIPLVGHTIGAIIVTLVALFHSPWAALIILAYYIFYQQVENYAIQPRIQANTTNLSPLLVFMAVVIGVSFGGLLGGLVAIPAMGCLRVLVVDYLHNHDKLEEINPLAEPDVPDKR